jgi:hypothetical protein
MMRKYVPESNHAFSSFTCYNAGSYPNSVLEDHSVLIQGVELKLGQNRVDEVLIGLLGKMTQSLLNAKHQSIR